METPRMKAARKGLRRYDGNPCRRCGGTERYVINNGCVVCSSRSKEQSTAKIRALMKQADHAHGDVS